MKKLNLALFLLVIFFVCNGQTFTIKGQVIDQEDESELPYVNIYVLNHTLGISSNSHGFFEFKLNNSFKNDTLVFSSVGYQSKKVVINSVSNGIIKLNKQIYGIHDITVYPSTHNGGSIVINRFNKLKCFVQYSPVEDKWIPSRPMEPTIEAFFFPYKEKYSKNNFIKEVWLYMSNYKTTPSYFLLRLFRPDEIGKPYEDIVNKPIKIEVTKSHSLLKIDLSKYNLSISEEGLFVGVELLIIDENKYVIKDKGKEIATLYSPFINYFESKTESFYWLYSKGIWSKQQKKATGGAIITQNTGLNRYLIPSISLVIRN